MITIIFELFNTESTPGVLFLHSNVSMIQMMISTRYSKLQVYFAKYHSLIHVPACIFEYIHVTDIRIHCTQYLISISFDIRNLSALFETMIKISR